MALPVALPAIMILSPENFPLLKTALSALRPAFALFRNLTKSKAFQPV